MPEPSSRSKGCNKCQFVCTLSSAKSRRNSKPLKRNILLTLALLIIANKSIKSCSSLQLNNLHIAPMVAPLSRVPLKKIASPFHELGTDAFADTAQFIRSRQFEAETHYVTTKDNYILTLHRIVNPSVPKRLRDRLKPVLMQHGLFTSSSNYLLSSDANLDRPRFDARDLVRTRPLVVYAPQSPYSWTKWLEMLNDLTLAKLGLTQSSGRLRAPQTSDSLAIELANQGYDVWLGNSRGSTYSLNHTKFDWRTDWRYWDFSFHEIGLFDVPAQIDYVLRARARSSLAYVGHSQGNLAMFILQSFHPEWKNKVKPFVAIAPVAYIPDMYFGAMRTLIRLIESTLITTTQLNRLVKGQLMPKSSNSEFGFDTLCVPKWSTPVCNLMLTLMLGNNLFRTNSSLTPVIMHHIPAGTSILNILHFGQLAASGEFRAFDFGPAENMQRYAQPVAPLYPIERISSPDIALIVGRTDTLSTVVNAEITRSKLRVPLMDYHVVPNLFWGHADIMYSSGAGIIANAHIIGLVDRYRLVDMPRLARTSDQAQGLG